MSEQLLQPLLAIYALLSVGMGVVSLLIYVTFKTSLTRAVLIFWVGQVVNLSTNALLATAPADSKYVVIPMYIWPVCMYALYLVMKVFNPMMKVSRTYVWLSLFGYTVSTVLLFFPVGFTWTTIPAVYCLGLMGYHLCYCFSKGTKNTSLGRIFIICTVLWVTHTLDYPFLRYYKDAALFGFTFYLIIVICYAQILLALALKNLSESKQHELEKLVEERSQQLITQSRLSALGEMAAGIAHEINNPLNIIVGRGELLKRKHLRNILSGEDLVNGLDVIERMAFRITKIIKALKDFSHQSVEVPFTPISMKEVLDQILPFCSERFDGGGIRLEILGQTDYVFEARGLLLSQVFLNLLNNAYDAVINENEKWVRIEVMTIGEKIRVLVSDSGPGISKELAQKIMQPFFTTKDVGKGTGLGLSISNGIMEQHNGRIYLDTYKKETTFVVELPVLCRSR